MNIKALQAFNAVVLEGSVSGAARVMNLSQPAVSRLISLLESELNLMLFKREKQRLHLTEEGAAFNREARRILAGLQEIPRIANEIRAQRLKRLRIVTMPRAALSVVAPAVARFTKEYPEVKVSIDIRSHRDLESWINGREYDLGFGNVPVSHWAVTSTSLGRADLEVLMPKDHAFASKKIIALKDLSAVPLVLQFPGMLLRRQIDSLFEANDVKIGREILTNSSQMSQHLVANGAGLTIIDRLSVLAMDDRHFTTRPLTPTRSVAFGVIRHRGDDPDPMVLALTDMLREQLASCVVKGAIEPQGTDSNNTSST
ncbi:LysR family transcriptional regulator [Cohaesibacter celericrescens]|uniref:LysR family transcriptional regulator n=1 Tax=Cohaesibacter celericrescens TaxID=2067669 RepID=A0A2N5XUW3_9HYPH|nr:LysR family transcriptional regulator [Cohaesibacter celericrescens]PLW78303.1 LysR family transcriptional regulator [Cohaesibacter celericrescens]